MSRLGVIIPTKTEFDILRDSLNHKDLIFMESGMGKVNACIALNNLISTHQCDKFLLFGFCGGLRGLGIGDTVEASEYIEGDFHAEVLGFQYPNSILYKHATGLFHRIPFISQDRFLTEDIYSRTIPLPVLACDMESFACASLSQRMGLSFYCVRVVSDIADENAVMGFKEPSPKLRETLVDSFNKTVSWLTK